MGSQDSSKVSDWEFHHLVYSLLFRWQVRTAIFVEQFLHPKLWVSGHSRDMMEFPLGIWSSFCIGKIKVNKLKELKCLKKSIINSPHKDYLQCKRRRGNGCKFCPLWRMAIFFICLIPSLNPTMYNCTVSFSQNFSRFGRIENTVWTHLRISGFLVLKSSNNAVKKQTKQFAIAKNA